MRYPIFQDGESIRELIPLEFDGRLGEMVGIVGWKNRRRITPGRKV
jgi:hypothetical protein